MSKNCVSAIQTLPYVLFLNKSLRLPSTLKDENAKHSFSMLPQLQPRHRSWALSTICIPVKFNGKPVTDKILNASGLVETAGIASPRL